MQRSKRILSCFSRSRQREGAGVFGLQGCRGRAERRGRQAPERAQDDQGRLERQEPDRLGGVASAARGREGQHPHRVRAGEDRLPEAA